MSYLWVFLESAADILSVTIPSAAPCAPSRISFGTCDNARKSIVAAASPRDACAHALAPSDVVFGVWHSLATEARLVPMLQTWAQSAQIVLLASRAGTSGTRLFHGSDAPGSNPLLLDTGVLEDDYFSTLGKAFIGLAMMHARFPRAKWFVVLGDDNYVLLANYVAALSAFDPQQPWALTRMVYRNAFQCKGIYQRSGGDVKKAAQEDKFHDIAFQRMVEGLGYSFTHVNEFLHEPPGYYFSPRTGQAHGGVALPARPAVLHYVPGSYMQHLHALTAEICTCDSSAHMDLLKTVAVGVYSDYRRLTAEDRQRVNNTWGKAFDVELVECESEQDSDAQQRGAASLSGRRLQDLFSHQKGLGSNAQQIPHVGGRCHLSRLDQLLTHHPGKQWLLLVDIDSYVIAANLAVRLAALGAREPICLVGVTGGDAAATLDYRAGDVLLSRALAERVLEEREQSDAEQAADPSAPLLQLAQSIDAQALVVDATFARGSDDSGGSGGAAAAGCTAPVVVQLRPDVSDLRPEFEKTEEGCKLSVAHYLVRAVAARSGCSARLDMTKGFAGGG
ncbi:hypothetical protein JKP88DRAFT_301244 [Tribonema minus]|uniref:Uncharacterized protein n=1 Tax=Tribonema minus TaxID=303371 RepID=A0A836CKM8_9STRA|nr:hypothetical protein JKP88DRAFT_301244 [Tribonema minus]